MEVRNYLTALRKGWWIIMIAVVLGGSAAAVYNIRATPQYASTVTFFISTPTEGGTSPLAADQFATRRITSYVGLLTSDLVAQRIIDTSHVDLTVGQVRSRISGDADLNTVLLTATVTDSQASRSLAISQAVATTFGSIVNQVDPIGPDNVVLRVISGPTLNPKPVSPRATFNLTLGIFAGLLLGVTAAVLRQLFDTSIRQPQLLRTLADAPVLGVVPYEKSAKKSPLIDSNARSIRAEALRQVRTNLQFIDVERPVRVLVVTSSIADEGKSTTAANLAVSFAESGRRVLLIEADLRRPRVADYLGLERSVGLTNLLAGQVEIDDVLQTWGKGPLSVLPSGSIPPNPSELLGSPRMLNLLERFKKVFEIVILDTPPLLPVTDAAVAAAHADGAVLVVRYGKTTRGQVTTAKRSLDSVDARLLGCILNMTPQKGTDGYETYGYGYDGDVDSGPAAIELSEQPVHDTGAHLLNGARRSVTNTARGSQQIAPDPARRTRRQTSLRPARPSER